MLLKNNRNINRKTEANSSKKNLRPVEGEETAIDLFEGIKGSSSEELKKEAAEEIRYRELMEKRRQETLREELARYASEKKNWEQKEAERLAQKEAEERAKQEQVLDSYFQNTDSDLFNTQTKEIIAASLTDSEAETEADMGSTSPIYEEYEEAVSLEEMIPAKVAAAKASKLNDLYAEEDLAAKYAPSKPTHSAKEEKSAEKAVKTVKGEKAEKVENTNTPKKKKKTSPVFYILIVIFAFIFLFSAYKLFTIWKTYHQAAVTNDGLQNIFHATMDPEARGNDDEAKQGSEVDKPKAEEEEYTYTSFSLAPLIEINPDTVAWLTIPGANVDHVVVQCSNDYFYLWRNFYGEENDCGTVFMECENEIGEPLQNLVIYGHRMRDGSMFAHMDVFLDQEFVDENPTFTMYMEDGEYECQVFAAYRTLTDVNYTQTSFYDEDEMMEFVNACIGRSEVTTNTTVLPGDLIVTLSTCDRPTDKVKGRLVIQARMVKIDPEKKNK